MVISWRLDNMKRNQIEINSAQAAIILEELKYFCYENRQLERDINISNDDKKALREERINVEMLIKQIEALKW